jgi:APA family basic amino acid/polyamine antiporter
MTTTTAPTETGEKTLFVRKASGLVKGWSSLDGYRYSFFSVNLSLGILGFSYATYIPGGSLFLAIVITTALMLLEVVVYAALISAMPRAGGDYVWQTRIFNSPVGFVLAVTGWWFIVWMWVPIWASVTFGGYIRPILEILGANSAANWLAGKNGVFVSSVVVIVVTTVLVASGMRGYARFQRWALWAGLASIAVTFIILLLTSKLGFHNAYNREALQLYGVKNAYATTLKTGGSGQAQGLFSGTLWQTMRLVPFMCFWLLWPAWGATLYGEVRGAAHFRTNIRAMGGGLLSASILGLVFLLLIAKTMGYHFFMATQAAPVNGIYMSPMAMVGWVVHSAAFQVILLLAMTMLVIAGWGTVFLSSTRVIFASAFDRVLPEKVAAVTRGGVPWVALLLMAIPSLIISALYAYTSWFATLTLDGTLVIAVMFLGSGLAFMIMPWRAKGIWANSSLPKVKVAGIPVLSVVAGLFSAFLIFNLVLWLKDAVYGSNNTKSLIYMGALYLIALLIWIIAAITRRREGMPLEAVAKQIPVE